MKPLCCTAETNICQSYLNFKKNKKKFQIFSNITTKYMFILRKSTSIFDVKQEQQKSYYAHSRKTFCANVLSLLSKFLCVNCTVIK